MTEPTNQSEEELTTIAETPDETDDPSQAGDYSFLLDRLDFQVLPHIYSIFGFSSRGDPTEYMVKEALDDYGATTIKDILCMSRASIEALIIPISRNNLNEKPLSKIDKNRLFDVIRFHRARCQQLGKAVMERNDWRSVTATDVETYLIGSSDVLQSADTTNLHTNTTPSVSGTVPSTIPASQTDLTTKPSRTPADLFSHSIKRDQSKFPLFKEVKMIELWVRLFESTAMAQGIGDMLLDSYIIPTDTESDEYKLHVVRNNYLYDVLLQCGKNRPYNTILMQSKCGVTTYRTIIKTFRQGTIATLSLQEHKKALKDLNISNWSQTREKFIALWEHDVAVIQNMANASEGETMTNKELLEILKDAVRSDPVLADVETSELKEQSKSNKTLDFDGYLNHLKQIIVIHNASDTKSKSSRKRSINAHEGGGTGKGLKAYEKYLQNDLYSVPSAIWNKKDFPKADRKAIAAHNRKVRAANDSSTSPPRVIKTGESAPTDTTVSSSNASSVANVRTALGSQNKEMKVNKAITIDGVEYVAKACHLHYSIHKSKKSRKSSGSLIDHGANGGLAGGDTYIIDRSTHEHVDITGIDDKQLNHIPIGTAAAKVRTTSGWVILIMHNYAILERGQTVHSEHQLCDSGNTVSSRSRTLTNDAGTQTIRTVGGYTIPLHIRNGLAYMDMVKPTKAEMEDSTIPHVMFTRDGEWDPTDLDNEIDLDNIHDINSILPEEDETNDAIDHRVSDKGEYLLHNSGDKIADAIQRVIAHHMFIFTQCLSGILGNTIIDPYTHKKPMEVHHTESTGQQQTETTTESTENANNQTKWKKAPIDYEQMRPMFGWRNVAIIAKTFEHTTQYARNVVRLPFRQHFKSRFPSLNVQRRNEKVATDTFFSDTPAIGCGVTKAQIFCGRQTFLTDCYPLKHKSDFSRALEDNIRKRGAMDVLISDRAKEEISQKTKDILRLFQIDDYQSEPNHQHQNFAENRIGTLKALTNTVMDRSGSEPQLWLLALQYACTLLNHLSHRGLDYRTPMEAYSGTTPDISMFTCFHFGQKVLFAIDNKFPSESPERGARWVGIAENVGDALTWKLLTDDTNELIVRSSVRPMDDKANTNKRIDTRLSDDEADDKIAYEAVVKSTVPYYDTKNIHAPDFDMESILGRYIVQPTANGDQHRAQIVKKIIEMEGNEERVKFLLKHEHEDHDSIIGYHELMELIEDQWSDENDQILWTFQEIKGHTGPLTSKDPEYKGSRYNLLIHWDDGSTTTEPLHIIAQDSPAICAEYAKKNNLLDVEGWKRFRRIAKNVKMLERQINEAKRKSYNNSVKYMFGVKIPRTYDEAVKFDADNGNTLWADAAAKEIEQIMDYGSYKDGGLNAPPPPGHKMIRCHMIFACKHDGRRKARFVAGGHLTDPPLHSVYSGVVSLRSIRLLTFVSELNGLKLWAADVTCAYLESYTKEKLCFKAGAEFENYGLNGHTLIMVKAVYGTKSAGRCWNERLADVLRQMGYHRSKADKEIWMRNVNDDHYEYIGCYVDDLCIVSKNPETIIDTLRTKHQFHLKGDGPMEYHLGCDYFREDDGTLAYSPRKYIKRVVENYSKIFKLPNNKPKTPLEKNDHPELDTTNFCTEEERALYWSLIGSFQWLISLGRFDIQCAVMTLSGFRTQPRKGHLERAKRLLAYIKHRDEAAIRVRTNVPNYDSLPYQQYDWMNEVYGRSTEHIPEDIPPPLGKAVRTSTYFDANLVHDYLSGRSVTGILHIINQTPFQWHSSKQGTVETSTYGSEFVAARTATDQVVDIRLTLQYMGVPIEPYAFMFGDNQSVITQSTLPHSQLTKRHHLYSYHRVREAVASGYLRLYHIDGVDNASDVLSKHCGYPQAWPILQPLLFWKGDTMSITEATRQESA